MKSVQKIDLGLTGYDELFMNDAERKENKLPRIYDIPLSEIDDFPDHPFKVKLDEDMDQLVQSIKERGIITPVTLRPKEDGRYEIVSGHRRKKACELAGFDTVKAEVREMTRDEAIILMVESNLQRSVILPSEKAFSYKMRLEAIFGKQSNVDLDKRIVVFDIHGLGSQLKPTGLLVITDTMLNRVTLNWKKGKRTHVFIDEFHVVFENEFSASFFNSAWRQFRKRNAYPTAITQNVEYLLDSVQASTMLSNSEFVIMLNQAASDRERLARLLNISNEQMSYITNADAGCGLIKYGSALVPFINRFPQNTKLYQLMTTRPGEGKFARGRD